MVATNLSRPSLDLDPKRIAATSAVIALHVAAAMALMIPVASAPPLVTPEDPPLAIVPTYQPPPPIEPLPVTHAPPHPVTTPVAHPTRTPQASAPTEATTPSDTGTLPPVDTTPPTFDPGPATPPSTALQADVAPAPPYPPMALRRRIEGKVLLRVLVDPQGNPTEVSIERSSGSRLLDETAQRFLRARWHFVPASQDGVAISAYALVPVDFRLE